MKKLFNLIKSYLKSDFAVGDRVKVLQPNGIVYPRGVIDRGIVTKVNRKSCEVVLQQDAFKYFPLTVECQRLTHVE